jgi:hypothetical protein
MSSDNGELFITSLRKSGAISKQMFSIYLGLSGSKQVSKMWFGGYDDSYVTAPYTADELRNKTVDDLISWMSITSKNYWQVSLNEAYVGSNKLSLAISKVVFDSGASLMYIPSYDYNAIYNSITTQSKTKCGYELSSQLIYCECTSTGDNRYPTV